MEIGLFDDRDRVIKLGVFDSLSVGIRFVLLIWIINKVIGKSI